VSKSRWFLIIIFFTIGFFTLYAISPAAAQTNVVIVAEVEGPVTPAMASYFDRAIAEAQQRDAIATLIILDTPGGAVDVTLEIVQSFRNSPVPIIIYIGPAGAQAASAGSIITLAAHAAGMAPETIIGAASPVDGSGADIEDTLYQKLTEDLKATMRNLTDRRGQEAVTLAEAMIDEARAVTAQEALESALIDSVASDVDDLLDQLDGLSVEVNGKATILLTSSASQEMISMTLIEQLLHALANPLLIGLLMTIGVQAILIEISNPGGWVAGFIGVLSLGLGLYGLGTLPSNWLGLGLIAVAFVLLFLEVKTPATGVLAVVGTGTLLAGLLVLFNSPGSPDFARISVAGAVIIAIFASGFFLFLVAKALQAQQKPPYSGAEGMIEKKGTVRNKMVKAGGTAEHFVGTVLVNGEVWKATSEQAIEQGQKVVVKGIDGMTLDVKLTDN
jgi:membrane-bound serine protease (ClpP class)